MSKGESDMKSIFVYLLFSIGLALYALAGSTHTICHFTHSQTYMNHSPEQILLMIFSFINLVIVLIKMGKQLPPIQQEFQKDSIFIESHPLSDNIGLV